MTSKEQLKKLIGMAERIGHLPSFEIRDKDVLVVKLTFLDAMKELHKALTDNEQLTKDNSWLNERLKQKEDMLKEKEARIAELEQKLNSHVDRNALTRKQARIEELEAVIREAIPFAEYSLETAIFPFEAEFSRKEIGAIVSTYTGIMLGDFHDMHGYIEKLMGRPVWTHEMGNKEFAQKIKALAHPDFIRLHEWITNGQ